MLNTDLVPNNYIYIYIYIYIKYYSSKFNVFFYNKLLIKKLLTQLIYFR